MPTRGNKHGEAAERVFYPAFDGGLNLAAPGESIARNELKEALNVEFSPLTGSIRARGGLVWSGHFDAEIDDALPVPGRRGFLVRGRNSRGLYYFRWNCIWPVEGALSGDGRMTGAAWGDDGLLVASGGALQMFTPWGGTGTPRLTAVSGAPKECRAVFVRNGRVGVATPNDDGTGVDTLRFSAVGDCESWENDVNDDSSGQFLEVGYKDGMDIDAVVPLSRDLIVFKSPRDRLTDANEPDKGVVWRLTGDYPDWQVLEAAHNTGTFGMESVQAVGNDIYYLTKMGLASLGSVTAYGEVKTAWPDRKVANALTRLIKPGSRLWNVPVKEQLWVLPGGEDTEVWVFDYGRGIWTQFEFPDVPGYAVGIDTELYVFIGADVYHVHDGYTRDEMYRAEPEPVRARMRMGVVLNGLQTLVKAAFASFWGLPDCTAELRLGGFRMPLRAGGTVWYIYGPPSTTLYASEDTRPLFPVVGVMTARQRCLARGWSVVPEVEVAGGGFCLNTMGLEIVEV